MCIGMLVILSLMLFITVNPGKADEKADPLSAIVQIESIVPYNARTADGLGTRRTGTGVVIDEDGLILTVGYVILEAIEVSVQAKGRNIRTRQDCRL